MKIAVVFNMKGGIGKTTLSVALAESLAFFQSRRVLLVDADAQMNASRRLCLPTDINKCQIPGSERNLSKYLKEAISKSKLPDPKQFIQKRVGTVHGAGAVDMLLGARDSHNTERLISVRLAEQRGATSPVFNTLANAFKNLGKVGKYDIVIFDCPPTFTTITQAALSSADLLIVPMVGDKASTIQFENSRQIMGDSLKCTGFKMPPEQIVLSKYKAASRSLFESLIQRFRADLKVKDRPVFSQAELFSKEQGSTIKDKYGSASSDLKALANAISLRLSLPVQVDQVLKSGKRKQFSNSPKETINVGKKHRNSGSNSERVGRNNKRKTNASETVGRGN